MGNDYDDAAVVIDRPAGSTAADVSQYQLTREGDDVKLVARGQFPDSGYVLAVIRGGSKGKPVYEFLQVKKDGPALDVITPFSFRTTVRSAHGVASYLDSQGGIQISGLRSMFDPPGV